MKQRIIDEHLKCAHETEFQTTKWRHIRKLDTREKLVCNLSQWKVTETESSVLACSLNFARIIPYEEFIVATEIACQKITNQGDKADLRNKVAEILKSAKMSHKNTNWEEWKAIQSIANGKTLKEELQLLWTLNSTKNKWWRIKNTYEVSKKDLAEDKKKKLKTLLKSLVDKGKIDKDNYNFLVPTASITPRIYSTPKIHKKDIPLRPIVDSIGPVTYNLSKALVATLQKLKATGTRVKHFKGIIRQDTHIPWCTFFIHKNTSGCHNKHSTEPPQSGEDTHK